MCSNCMTTTTIVDVCGKIPSFEHGGNFSIWEANLEQWNSICERKINKLCTYDIEVQEFDKVNVMEDTWASTLWMPIGAFR